MREKKIKKEVLNVSAVFAEDPDGGYTVSVPELRGCVSQGNTFEEALSNIKEAIELYLEDEKEIRELKEYRPKSEFLISIPVYA